MTKSPHLHTSLPHWVAGIFLVGSFLTASLSAQSLGLTEAEFSEAWPILQSHFPDQSPLQDKNLSCESLNNLLPTLGAAVSSDPVRNATTEPLKVEILPGQITYWRLATYQPTKGTDLEALLVNSLGIKSKGLILDLRDTQAPNDFDGVTQLMNNLVPLSTVLFSVQGIQTPQAVFQITQQKLLYHHPILILINRGTIGSGEALAATLRRSAKAILIGRTAPAAGGMYAEYKLKSGRYLRLITAKALLPDGTNLCAQPLQPDIPVFVDDQQEGEALAQIRLGSAAQGLIQFSHKRLSEAALVRQEDPELDDYFNKSGKPKDDDTVQDMVLMHAVDILNAINAIFPTAPMATSS